jgi:hypothetical protein
MGLIDYSGGIKFVIALGSIVGLLGLVLGLILFIIGGPRIRARMIRLLITSIALIIICGLYTGKKFFHI